MQIIAKKMYWFLILCVLIASCQHKEQSLIEMLQKDYKKIISSMDQDYFGRGQDILSEIEKDRPMAYGLILRAETNRFNKKRVSSSLENLRRCGIWLLEHSDINKNGVFGYGLADKWDAFGDNSPNPENQEYTITTAIVIDGLIDWMVADQKAPKNDILITIGKCLIPYLSGNFNSPSGLYAYSLNTNDLKYDVFNPAVYLAGQMQRFSLLIKDASLKKKIQQEADRIMMTMLTFRKLDTNSNWYWDYGLQNNLRRPNDLKHALYIIEGIRNYCVFGGNENRKINMSKVFGHIDSFYSSDKKRWYEFVGGKKDKYIPRLWALGMALYIMSTIEPQSKSIESLIEQIKKYQAVNGKFMYKPGRKEHYIRHDAHLLLGISYYLY